MIGGLPGHQTQHSFKGRRFPSSFHHNQPLLVHSFSSICWNQPVTGKADVYSLGMIFYGLINGSPPYLSEETFKTALANQTRLEMNPAWHGGFVKVSSLFDSANIQLNRRISTTKYGSSQDWVDLVFCRPPCVLPFLMAPTDSGRISRRDDGLHTGFALNGNTVVPERSVFECGEIQKNRLHTVPKAFRMWSVARTCGTSQAQHHPVRLKFDVRQPTALASWTC